MRARISDTYIIEISVDMSELNEIMRELEESKERIYKCYCRLKELGIVSIKEEPALQAQTSSADHD